MPGELRARKAAVKVLALLHEVLASSRVGPPAADRRGEEAGVHGAKPDDVGNDLDRLESGVGEGVLPLLGGEEAGHRTRLGVERHVDEALEYLERDFGTDRRGGDRAQRLTEREPPPA